MSKSLLSNHNVFEGQHCETTATGNLLSHLGFSFSEAMMFGLGEGLGFIFLNLSSLNLPFVGGRSKPFELTRKLCANLSLVLEEKETSSKTKAWENLCRPLQNGVPVGLQLDSYYLDYFTSKIHFAGHAVACLGTDDEFVSVIDTKQQGGLQKVAISSLEKARFAKGPMSAKGRSWTIQAPSKKMKFELSLKKAIRQNAESYLSPEFKGMSYLGIESWPSRFRLGSKSQKIPRKI